MAASVLSHNGLSEALVELSKFAKPTGYADIAALGVIALSSAGYLLRGIAWDKPDPYTHIWFEKPQEKFGAGANAKKETRNIAEKLEETGKDLVIFWGSQSGTAEGFANRLARECHLRFGLETMAADLSDYDPETIALIPNSKLAMFIVSTFGEGDPSDNTAGLWDWIRKSSDVSLSNIRYAAFGLGNSNYKYYNRVVDVVVEALNRFGAKMLMPVGKADDAEGSTEEDFMEWKDTLFTYFRQELHFEEREVAHEPTLSVVEDESLEPIDLHHGDPVQPTVRGKTAAACSPIKALAIKNSRELFSSSTRNCVHMELDLADHPELTYKTGDHLAVWPTNPDVEVERLLKVLGLTGRQNTPISIRSLDETVKVKVPTPTTPDALFRHYLEICGPVSRDKIIGLAQFAPTPAAKSFLTTLAKDKATYADFLTRTHLTIGRLLELSTAGSEPGTTWPALPLSYLIETLPSLQPRYYSISSSSTISPRHPSITALVTSTPLPGSPETVINGLTSNYLFALSSPSSHPQGLTYHSNVLGEAKLHAHIRRSKFHLPDATATPLVLVCAGTGLAPFRAFVAERARLRGLGREDVGRVLLFYGCRRPDEDYIYRAELEAYEAQLGGLLEVVTAFSRVQGEARWYVQDRVEERGEEVAALMGQGASFYVCGRAAMAREVGRRVGEVVGRVNGWGDGQVREWSEGVKRRGKWLEDVWG